MNHEGYENTNHRPHPEVGADNDEILPADGPRKRPAAFDTAIKSAVPYFLTMHKRVR